MPVLSYKFIILLSTIFFHSTLAILIDFANYPAGSKSCLFSATNSSKCDQSTVPAFNACACSNGGNFVTSLAQCLQSSDPGDLTTVHTTLYSNCRDSNTPLPYSLQQFLALGGGSVPVVISPVTTSAVATITQQGTVQVTTLVSVVAPVTQTAAVVTTVIVQPTGTNQAPFTSVVTIPAGSAIFQTFTSTTTGSKSPQNTQAGVEQGNTDKSTSKGLGTTAIIGIAVGGALFLALIGVIFAICWKQRRKEKTTVSAAPLLPPSQPIHPTSFHSRPHSTVTTMTDQTPMQQQAPFPYYDRPISKSPISSNIEYSPQPSVRNTYYGTPPVHQYQYPSPQPYDAPLPASQVHNTGYIEMPGSAYNPQELPGTILVGSVGLQNPR